MAAATHELAGLGETRTEETGDLLDEGLRGEERVVLLGELQVVAGGGRVSPASPCHRTRPAWQRRTFLTSFLFLLSFLRSSTDMYSSSMSLARSMSAASARMQIDMRGRGMLGSLAGGGTDGSVRVPHARPRTRAA